MCDIRTIQPLADALARKGYETLTPVQIAVTAAELSRSDLLVSAQTGSGKTVGFGLAIAPTLLGEDSRFGLAEAPLALVIAPTRELALQVKREFDWLFATAGAVVASCVGGMDMRSERRALERGAHIVVATPGRLRDHIMRGSLDMSALRAVVLDEADEMLALGFREDLEFILGEAPADRRTLMFSATVPKEIATLAKTYQKPDAVRVTTTAEKSQHVDIEYRALNVASSDSENAIINVLRYYEARNALVFCNTRAMVNRLTARFSNRGFSVVALSGELSQNERTHALQAMRDGRARVCVATDVAARGIDLPNLELVVHAELPSNAETLLHRSGRTGRAGRKGVSALIVPGKSRAKAERLLRFARITAEWAAAPSAEEVLQRDEERLLSDPLWTESIAPEEQGFVDRLTAQHSAEQIAAAYLRLHQSRVSAPEELANPNTPEKRAPRGAFGPSTWFAVSVGRSQNAEPRWLLPMLCRAGNISKDAIGAIRVQPNESFVEISDSAVAGFLAALGPDMTLEAGAVLRQLPGAPEISSAPRRGLPAPGGKSDKPRKQAPRSERDEVRAEPVVPADLEKPKARPAHRPKDKPAHFSKPKPADEGRKPAAKTRAKREKPDHSGALSTFKKGAGNASVRLGKDGKPQGKPKAKGARKGGFSKPVRTGAGKGGNAPPRRKPAKGGPKG